MKTAFFCAFFLVVMLNISGCQTIEGGYPDPGPLIGYGRFEHKDFWATVHAANPKEVTSLYGPKFASRIQL